MLDAKVNPDDLRRMARPKHSAPADRRSTDNRGDTPKCPAPSQPDVRPDRGLADGRVEIVDLTQPLSESTPVIKLPPPFVNTPGLSRSEISHYDERGPAWAWYTLTIGEHVGTHVDAPIHWVTGQDGADIGSISRRDA